MSVPAPAETASATTQVSAPPAAGPGGALRRLWATVLGVAEVGPFDDFFDLGGDSILLLQMLSGARQLGVDLDLGRLGEFLEEATCTRLLELTGNDTRPDPAAGAEGHVVTTITLRPGDAASTVFVLLPSLYDLWAVRELSTRVEDASIHVLVPTWSPARPYLSVPELGEAMAARIAALQPTGPCRVVGSCAAGLAALEAVGRLRRSGRAIDLLALVDTQPPRPRRGPAPRPLHRLLPIRPGTRGMPPALFAKLMWLDILRTSTRLRHDDLMRYLWDAVRAHIDDLLRFLVEVQPERWTDPYRERAAAIFMTWLGYQLASEAYEAPPRYPGRVALRYSERTETDCAEPAQAAEAWARLTGCAYDLETFAEGHDSAIMSNPAVVRLVSRSLRP